MNRRRALQVMALGAVSRAATAAAAWSAPAVVEHDEKVCMSYRARLDGPYLVIRIALQPGWHTFALDNKQRVDEKLAGRKALAQDKPTEIAITGGLKAEGNWLQSPPKDFSKPELRLFAYGFENEATLAIKVKGSTPAKIAIQGQACTETVCKNIDLELSLPGGQSTSSAPAELDVKKLVAARLTT